MSVTNEKFYNFTQQNNYLNRNKLTSTQKDCLCVLMKSYLKISFIGVILLHAFSYSLTMKLKKKTVL